LEKLIGDKTIITIDFPEEKSGSEFAVDRVQVVSGF
jgi:hypothetical protein